jgi:diketogulonate reductase-like aldo/keto reductase
MLGIPKIGQGTWNMERDDRKEAVRALQRGIELGLTHIDTAELYGRGEVERIVADAIRGKRDKIFLASKVLPSNASHQGILEACDASLARLGVERLDLYMLHWPGDHPLEDTLRAFAELAAAGKIAHYGVSNFDERELAEAVRIAGPGKIACNQVLYHLEERAIEHAVLPACRTHDVALVGYSPFGSGAFPERGPGRAALDAIAKTHGATARQVALAFLSRDPALFAIPKAARVPHVEEAAGAQSLRLTDAEIARIDAAFPRARRRPGVPTL